MSEPQNKQTELANESEPTAVSETAHPEETAQSAESFHQPADGGKASAEEKTQTKTAKKKVGRKKKKRIKKIIIWVVILAVVAGFVCYKMGIIGTDPSKMQSSQTYNTYVVSRRDIQNVLTGTGTLEPYDSYTVTALASGEIVEDLFEEGDEVTKDQLLMRIDSSSLESSLERAQNSYDNAKKSLDDLYETRDDLNVVSDWSGVIQVMDIEVGDEVMSGTVIASIIDRDTMLIDVPFMQADTFSISKGDTAVLTIASTLEQITGTVDSISPSYTVNANGVKESLVTIAVNNPGGITESTSATAKIGDYSCTKAANFYYNVNEQIKAETSGEVARIIKDEGDYVTAGETVVVLESESLDDNIENAERSLKEAANSLKDAQDAFDNYEITAPISGTVIEKNYKLGEKIGSSSGSGSGNTIAVIYDMSALKFEMNIDELDIDSLEVGQQVNVTSDAKPGTTYVGEITYISVQGTTSSGTTYYPITVTLSDYGSSEQGTALRPGMNIDAEIVLEKAENVIAIPVDAVARGNKVKVISTASVSDTGNGSGENTEHNEAENPGSLSGGSPAQNDMQENGDIPGNTDVSENGDIPGNANVSENGGMAGTGEMPDLGELSEGEMPDLGEFPEGEMPDLGEFPEGEMPDLGELSENGELPDFEGMTAQPTQSSGQYSTVPNTTEYIEVTVETGISDDEYIEIVSGLNEGDVIIVESAQRTSSYSDFGGMGMMGMGGMPSGGMGGMPSGGMGGGPRG